METNIELYLDLMKRCLTYYLWGEPMEVVRPSNYRSRLKRLVVALIIRRFARNGVYLLQAGKFDPSIRTNGIDHPQLAHTMIGMKRLDNLQSCIEDVLTNDIPGDLIETGVWRGGATIFMRAMLKAYHVANRKVWAADSFQGLPPPNPSVYPADLGDKHYQISHLAVSLAEVKENFRRYDLLDDQVGFLEGWFKDTLPRAPIESLAVLRLDGDMYESTMDALTHLYPKLSWGGYLIVDDYGYIDSCRQAVRDYRRDHGIQAEIQHIDWSGVFWKKA